MSTAQRVVLVVTGLTVAVLAGLFSFMSWEQADQLSGVISGLVGVAGLGGLIWGVMAPNGRVGIRASRTGRATSVGGGSVNTGVSAPSSATSAGVEVDRTGDARADGGGNANSGIELT